LAHTTLRRDFRHIDPTRARIVLIEGADRVLPPFRSSLSDKARTALGRLGVEVWIGAQVTNIQAGEVTVRRGGVDERLAAQTVVWAAGVAASPLGKMLADKAQTEIDRSGRVVVQPDLSIPGHPEVFVVGDLAAVKQRALSQSMGGTMPTLPGVAPVAMQEGRYVANAINGRLRGEAVSPFVYHDKGTMATIGRNSAVADLGWVSYSGYLAWLTWLFIHLLYLVQFQSRVLVLIQWAWSYVTRNRSARLITNETAKPLMVAPRAKTATDCHG
jgi:NADH:ubiquinone reductase (H+-translocating)